MCVRVWGQLRGRRRTQRVCTHRGELSEGDRLLAFGDGVEELLLHAGHEPVFVKTKQHAAICKHAPGGKGEPVAIYVTISNLQIQKQTSELVSIGFVCNTNICRFISLANSVE